MLGYNLCVSRRILTLIVPVETQMNTLQCTYFYLVFLNRLITYDNCITLQVVKVYFSFNIIL